MSVRLISAFAALAATSVGCARPNPELTSFEGCWSMNIDGFDGSSETRLDLTRTADHRLYGIVRDVPQNMNVMIFDISPEADEIEITSLPHPELATERAATSLPRDFSWPNELLSNLERPGVYLGQLMFRQANGGPHAYFTTSKFALRPGSPETEHLLVSVPYPPGWPINVYHHGMTFSGLRAPCEEPDR